MILIINVILHVRGHIFAGAHWFRYLWGVLTVKRVKPPNKGYQYVHYISINVTLPVKVWAVCALEEHEHTANS